MWFMNICLNIYCVQDTSGFVSFCDEKTIIRAEYVFPFLLFKSRKLYTIGIAINFSSSILF